MKDIQGIVFRENTREELLPEFDPAFPYIATRVTYGDPVTPWHWHHAVELFYVESGALEYTTPGGTARFPAGSGGFINSNVLHTTWIPPSGEETVALFHIFDPVFLSGGQDSRISKRYVLPLTAAQNVEIIPLDPQEPTQNALLLQIQEALHMQEDCWGYELQLRQRLTGIWMELLAIARSMPNPRQSHGNADSQIKAMMIYVHEHYRESISAQHLADAGHVSKRTCFRLFQEKLHMSPVEYIRSYRLQKACQLLAGTTLPITDIAYTCGLGSSSYFGKLFRQVYGCTPKDYRKLARS